MAGPNNYRAYNEIRVLPMDLHPIRVEHYAQRLRELVQRAPRDVRVGARPSHIQRIPPKRTDTYGA
eukprot:1962233-Pyramimonas_sp.AAC.1